RRSPRPPVRTDRQGRPAHPVRTSPNGRRPGGPNPRLLRQRLTVFVVVTLLVALGIAAAQGCQGPANGLGAPPSPTESVSSAAPDSVAAEPDGR
ncbi:serine/threonine protein kinase, partial [Streptomyces sp. SID8361]|nr:serine/threonine protein kinase [Streptomyces sp. SID8361]